MRKALYALTVSILSFWGALEAQVTTYPYTQDFSTATLCDPGFACPGDAGPCAAALPTGWSQVVGEGDDFKVTTGATASGQLNVGSSGQYVYDETSSTCSGVDKQMTTEVFDMSSLTVPRLTVATGFNQDGIITIESSTDGGATFTTTVLTVNATTAGIGWSVQTIDIPALGGQANVAFRIGTSGTNSFQDDIGIDDFGIAEAPTCPAVTALSVDSVASDAAEVSWTDVAGATTWEVEYGPAPLTPGSGTTVLVSSAPTTLITGLSATTNYDWFVRPICAPGDTGVFTQGATFTTLGSCGVFTIDIEDSFGDGWNGGFIDVYVNGALFQGGFTLASGSGPLTLSVPVDSNDVISIDYTGGGFTAENEIYVFDQTGALVATEGVPGTPNDIGTPLVPSGLVGCPSCPAPSGLTVDSVAADAVELSWTDNAGAGEWVVAYAPSPIAPSGPFSTQVANNDTALVTGLSSATSYDFVVVAVCAPGDTSVLEGPVSATTPLGPLNCSVGQASTLFLENFEVEPPVGWTGDFGLANGDWDITPGNSNSFGTGPFTSFSGSNHMEYEASGSATAVASAVSPAIDLSAVAASPRLVFYYHAFGDDIGTLDVGVGTSPTGPFTTEFTVSGPQQLADTDPWIPVSVDLSAYIGSTIYIEFAYGGAGTGFEGDLSIDSMTVEGCLTCPVPSGATATAFGSDSALFAWNTSAQDSTYLVEYGPSGFALGTGTVVTTTADSVWVTGLLPATTYDFYVSSICFGPDSSAGTLASATTDCAPVFPTPYCDNFDSWTPGLTGPTINDCWDGFNTTDPNWEVEVSGTGNSFGTGPLNDASGSGNYIYMETSSAALGESDTLFSPPLDLSGLTLPRLSFAYHMFGDDMGTLSVIIEDVNTGVQQTVFSVSGQQQASETAPWIDASAYLTDFIGDTVIVHFVGTHGGTSFEGDMAIDEFCLEEGPSCPEPTNLSVDSITGTEIFVSWDYPLPTTPTFEVEYGPTGFTPGTGTILSTTDTFAVISGLTNNTEYDHYFYAVCGPGDSSIVLGPVTVATECGFFAVPYCQDFEAGTPLDRCWTNATGDDLEWTPDQFGTTSGGTGPSAAFDGTWYLYTETSGSGTGDEGIIFTPEFDLGTVPFAQLDFWYHMFGAGMDPDGTIEVDITNDGGATFTNIFTQTGNQGDQWNNAVVPLDAYAGDTVQFRITGTVAPNSASFSFENDFAIDAFCITEMPANDIAVTEILEPEDSCGSSSTDFSVVVSNVGTADQTTVPLVIEVTGTDTFTLSEVLFNVVAFSTDTITLPTSISTLGGGSWTISAYADLATDTLPGNDTATTSVSFGAVPDAPMSMDQTICLGDSAILSATTSLGGTLNWYDSLAATAPFFVGDSGEVAPTVTSTYYVAETGAITDSLTLDLFDSFGDGWNGAETEVLINGSPAAGSPFTIATGGSASFQIPATSGDVIELVHTTGGFPFEESYELLDFDGNLLFDDGPNPATGSVFTTTLEPGCEGPRTAVTVNVSVPTLDTLTLVGCDDLVLPNGTFVASSGVITDSLTNVDGCDSVMVYDVTINNSQSSAQTVSACGGSAFTLPDGTVVTTPGVYTTTFTGANGCDSTIITNLSFDANIQVFQSVPLCDGDSVVVGPNVYDLEGVYIDTFTAATGCDSIITTSVVNLPLIDFDLTDLSTICEDASPVTLDLEPVGGTLTGPGVSGNTFDPSVAGLGTQVLTYSFTDLNGCSGSATFEIEVVTCTGIEDIEGIETVTVRPNPFDAFVDVVFDNDAAGDDMTFTVMDMTGKRMARVVHDPIVGANSVRIELDDVAAGLYMLEIERGGRTHVVKLLKR